MENETLKNKILKEAIRIGDRLLEHAQKDDTGMRWETLTMGADQKIGYQISESIYSGTSGISLFLLELYKRSGNSEYLNAAKEGMQWTTAYCRNNPSSYFAFFTGRMGVSYTMLKMAEATGDRSWTEKALEVVRPCTAFLDSPYTINDLINGTSGTVLGLLHMYEATGEKWMIDTIERGIRHLLHNAYQGPRGLYWDRSGKNISGLCGFSHGASGVGWVFLELGNYFKNDSFFHVARQAFLYESHFYNTNWKNWKDLRKGIYSPDDDVRHRKAFQENDMAFFTSGGDMNAWCHGAAGIGLSRLRAVELFNLLPHRLYLKQALTAIEKTIATNIEGENKSSSFILCHGGGGNAELFLKAYELFGDAKYLTYAETIAKNALAYREEHGNYISGYQKAGDQAEDNSLFMGNAGIGYFYLRVLAPREVPSILIPSPPEHKSKEKFHGYPFITISLRDTGKELLKKYFQRTIQLAEAFIPDLLKKFFIHHTSPVKSKQKALRHAFITFIEDLLPSLPPKEQNCFSDVFILEREKILLDDAVPSHSWVEMKNTLLSEKADELIALDDEAFLKLELILEPGCRIATTDWNWDVANQQEWTNNINLEPDIFPLLLKPVPTGILEEWLSPLSYTILGEFDQKNIVDNVRQETINAFEALTPDQEKMLTGKIIEQIKQALLAGVLIKA
jgi:rhamnogalacturonyl hydrolase YesR